MGAVGGVVALVAVLVTIAATLAVSPPVWRAFSDGWRRIPPERRPRAWFGAGLALLVLVVVAVLLILQPWGSDTVVWVVLGGGPFMLFALAGVSAQAVIDVRRARRRRIESHRSASP